jgi:hypothetical protein
MDTRIVRDRNLVAFAILGLLNNIVFSISNASAGTVLPGAVGLVYIINTAPGLLIKLVAPLWITYGSYNVKIALVGLSLLVNIFALLTPGVPTWLALLGIALGDTGSSAGEATCMALTQFYAQPQRHITFFALGTGCAGVGGYLIKMYVVCTLPQSARGIKPCDARRAAGMCSRSSGRSALSPSAQRSSSVRPRRAAVCIPSLHPTLPKAT